MVMLNRFIQIIVFINFLGSCKSNCINSFKENKLVGKWAVYYDCSYGMTVSYFSQPKLRIQKNHNGFFLESKDIFEWQKDCDKLLFFKSDFFSDKKYKVSFFDNGNKIKLVSEDDCCTYKLRKILENE
jgi:hypothetical protein